MAPDEVADLVYFLLVLDAMAVLGVQAGSEMERALDQNALRYKLGASMVAATISTARNNCYDLCCMPTATDHIVALLLAERDKLNRAIEAIQGSIKRRGRPPRTLAADLSAAVPKKRHVSAASRRRMALAQKRRWAARRAARS